MQASILCSSTHTSSAMPVPSASSRATCCGCSRATSSRSAIWRIACRCRAKRCTCKVGGERARVSGGDGRSRASRSSGGRSACRSVRSQAALLTDQGGHGFLRRLDAPSSTQPETASVVHTFSKADTARIRAFCRQHKVGLGDLQTALARIAFARMMHRFRLDGRIDDAEWDVRRKLPIYMGAPLNIRPFCGEQAGVQIAIGTRLGILPAMPTVASRDRMPELHELASSARLVRHARLLTRQRLDTANHPLEREIMCIRAQGWSVRGPPMSEASAIAEHGPMVTTIIGGSTGDMDAVLPAAFPIGSTAPTLRLEESTIHLRCRHRELYLGACGQAITR